MTVVEDPRVSSFSASSTFEKENPQNAEPGGSAPSKLVIPEGYVPVLGARAREKVRLEWVEHAHTKCDDEIRKFVECSKEHGWMVVFKCRKERDCMSDCAKQYTTQEDHNARTIAHARAHPEDVIGWEKEGVPKI